MTIDLPRIDLPHLAAGGPITRPSIVGEHGPELFVPRSAGTIIPNYRLSELTAAPAAGGTTNITVQLPTTARPDPFEVATQLRRLADFGVLSPR